MSNRPERVTKGVPLGSGGKRVRTMEPLCNACSCCKASLLTALAISRAASLSTDTSSPDILKFLSYFCLIFLLFYYYFIFPLKNFFITGREKNKKFIPPHIDEIY
jgi:hypothetical protein